MQHQHLHLFRLVFLSASVPFPSGRHLSGQYNHYEWILLVLWFDELDHIIHVTWPDLRLVRCCVDSNLWLIHLQSHTQLLCHNRTHSMYDKSSCPSSTYNNKCLQQLRGRNVYFILQYLACRCCMEQITNANCMQR